MAIALLRRKHQQVQRQRRDFHHKTALYLLRTYDTMYHEAIRAANLSGRPTALPDGSGGYLHNGAKAKAELNKSIHDAGWGQFLTILACKAEWAGKRVEAVNPAYTSQDCSRCGARVPKSLGARTPVCTHCGLVLDRDENAARNIQRAGQALRGVAELPAALNREAPCL
jgi:putative transposase